MAISLIAKPQIITPAYNEVKFIYDSTNKNEDGFRYVFDIYETGGSKIAEYRVLPNLSGYGEVDLSRLLQTYVSVDFDPTVTTFQDAANSYYKYDVNIGEEYIQTYDYTSSLTQNGSYTQINLTSQPFSVGDQVVIVEDTGANPSLNGLFTVLESNANDFTVNCLWSNIVDPTEDGNVSYADNRKTVTRDIRTDVNNYVFNGAIPFCDMPSYDNTKYVLDDNKDFLTTSSPEERTITLEQDVWLNFMTNGVSGHARFENSTGDVFQKTVTATDLITQVAVGANNFGSLTLVSGSGSLIEDDVDYYDVYFYNAAQHSRRYRFHLDRRCKIQDYEIAFLDRMGSISSYAFQLKDYLRGQVKKDVYNQNIDGYVDSTEWKYNTYAQGRRVIYPSIEEVFELNTNWMDETEAAYFTEMVSSPYTWIKIDDVYYSCIVQDTGYEKERQRNKNLIKKSIKVKLSVQDRVNG